MHFLGSPRFFVVLGVSGALALAAPAALAASPGGDTTAPTLSCPPSVSVIDSKGGPPGDFAFFSVTASDDQDPTPSVVCVPASGSFFPRGTTMVTCTAMDVSGNQASCMFPVIVLPSVKPGFGGDILIGPSSQVGCSGGSVVIAVQSSPPGATFVWRKNGSPLDPAETNSSLVLSFLTAGDAGSYDVVATLGSQTLHSNDAVLTIADAPVITMQPASVTVSTSVPVMFSVTATGLDLTYQWKHRSSQPFTPFVTIPGATNPVLVLEQANSSNDGAYRCIVKNQCGTTQSLIARLIVL